MPLFRRGPSLPDLTIQVLHPDTMPAVHALYGQTEWASLSLPHDELEIAVDDQISLVAVQGDKVWAAVLSTWSHHPAAWIRAVLVRQPLRPADILPTMFEQTYHVLAERAGQALYVMSDHFDVLWLRPLLFNAGFKPVTEVIGYEKRTLHVPGWGNPDVLVRPATYADIMEIAAVDAEAFPLEWIKSPQILTNVMPIAPCYLVCEAQGEIIGYAFATVHHGGSTAHLVRIAARPRYQGQGIGIRLLAEVTQWCQQHQIQMISLNTQANNTHAQRLYEWFGFVRTPERQLVLSKPIELFTP